MESSDQYKGVENADSNISVEEQKKIGFPAPIGIGTHFDNWENSLEALSRGWKPS